MPLNRFEKDDSQKILFLFTLGDEPFMYVPTCLDFFFFFDVSFCSSSNLEASPRFVAICFSLSLTKSSCLALISSSVTKPKTQECVKGAPDDRCDLMLFYVVVYLFLIMIKRTEELFQSNALVLRLWNRFGISTYIPTASLSLTDCVRFQFLFHSIVVCSKLVVDVTNRQLFLDFLLAFLKFLLLFFPFFHQDRRSASFFRCSFVVRHG